MSATNSWGFAIVLDDNHDIVVPLRFDRPDLPQDVMTSFNALVKDDCEERQCEHTHQEAVKCAIELLIQGLDELLADGKSEGEIAWPVIHDSAEIISLLTGFQFWLLHCKRDGHIGFGEVRVPTRQEAEQMMHLFVLRHAQGRSLKTCILGEGGEIPMPPPEGRAW